MVSVQFLVNERWVVQDYRSSYVAGQIKFWLFYDYLLVPLGKSFCQTSFGFQQFFLLPRNQKKPSVFPKILSLFASKSSFFTICPLSASHSFL